jgi:hypothetical protein
MKQFIVLMAVLPLMLALIMQIGQAQSNFMLIARAERVVDAYANSAGRAGGFSAEIGGAMAMRLAEICGVAASDIPMTLDGAPGADGLIRYRVGVPVNRLVAASSFFGIKEADNVGLLMIEGEVSNQSESEADTD